VIYCVVPSELEQDLYEKLVAYYSGNEAVTVVVDRRAGGDRRGGRPAGDFEDRRAPGDRRRHGAGGFVSTDIRNP
jgi:hypothetical protein